MGKDFDKMANYCGKERKANMLLLLTARVTCQKIIRPGDMVIPKESQGNRKWSKGLDNSIGNALGPLRKK